MPRPRYALLWIVKDELRELYATFRRQRLFFSFGLVILVFLFAVVFSFLAFSPVLSPFAYPLF